MNNLWQTSQPRFQMQQVLDAWAAARELNIVDHGGASSAELDEAERVLGRALPMDLRRLYAAHNGGSFLGGNFQLDPLFPNVVAATSLTTGSNQFREWQFPVPDELVMFGESGSESWYGIWLPTTGSYRPLIVEVGETSEPESLAIVGDDLASFLAGRSAYYFCLFAEDGFDLKPALDILGVPKKSSPEFSVNSSVHFWFKSSSFSLRQSAAAARCVTGSSTGIAGFSAAMSR